MTLSLRDYHRGEMVRSTDSPAPLDPLIQIAESVRTYLAEQDWGCEITVRRIYDTDLDLHQMEGIYLDVVLADPRDELGTRSDLDTECVLDVALRTKVASTDPETIDPLVALARRVFVALVRPAAIAAAWKDTAHTALFVPQHLRELGQFTSLVAVTFGITEGLPP
jgi:hypothetical protein